MDSNTDAWSCEACTFSNHRLIAVCEMCDAPMPPAVRQAQAAPTRASKQLDTSNEVAAHREVMRKTWPASANVQKKESDESQHVAAGLHRNVTHRPAKRERTSRSATHLVLCIDMSGSMRERDVLSIDGPQTRWDAVFDCCQNLIRTQLKMGSANAVCSVVLFNTVAYVPISGEPVDDRLIQRLRSVRHRFSPAKGTHYHPDHEGHCVFLSDGRPGDLDKKCKREQPAIRQAKQMRGLDIVQFTCLGIGGGVKHEGKSKGKRKRKVQLGEFFWLKKLSELLHGRFIQAKLTMDPPAGPHTAKTQPKRAKKEEVLHQSPMQSVCINSLQPAAAAVPVAIKVSASQLSIITQKQQDRIQKNKLAALGKRQQPATGQQHKHEACEAAAQNQAGVSSLVEQELVVVDDGDISPAFAGCDSEESDEEQLETTQHLSHSDDETTQQLSVVEIVENPILDEANHLHADPEPGGYGADWLQWKQRQTKRVWDVSTQGVGAESWEDDGMPSLSQAFTQISQALA